MPEDKPFSINVGQLKARPKQADQSRVEAVDKAAAEHGFVQREPGGRRGRPKSPRTGQVHAKVLPNVADEISQEAQRRGVTQGVVIEEAWAAYLESNGRR
ncbi:chromosome partitioning protein ParB [Novosphingobium profundi]|uniref:chromosome partitioning protein ParB n=1 Tax=Novosphingobium TaxID=165696 RepID=UPI0009FE0F31|nr:MULTISPECIES: chromosome partitioning protein ParB [Novosphingobium]MBT0671572.1 chromosome partitioning protein ParB [Novosphingobium profundi]